MTRGGTRIGLAHEQINEVTETALMSIGEQRELDVRRARLLKVFSGLEEASRIRIERLRNRVEHARADLREAQDELSSEEEIAAQEAEILVEFGQLNDIDERTLAELEREVVRVGQKNGGANHVLLAGNGEVKGAVARRKHLRDNGEISPEEASAI